MSITSPAIPSLQIISKAKETQFSVTRDISERSEPTINGHLSLTNKTVADEFCRPTI